MMIIIIIIIIIIIGIIINKNKTFLQKNANYKIFSRINCMRISLRLAFLVRRSFRNSSWSGLPVVSFNRIKEPIHSL